MRRMNHVVFASLAVGALGASLWLVWRYRTPLAAAAAATESPLRRSRYVTDATGAAVAIGDYRRVASCSTISDAVLPDLISVDRMLSVTSWFDDHNPLAFRTRGKVRLVGAKDLDALVALRPDLVVVADITHDLASIERLREYGLTVFDLGQRLGQRSLEQSMRDLGQLLGEPERGAQLAKSFHRRMRQVAAHVPSRYRRRGMYLNLSDTQIHGGTLGSSYHDVLIAAGIIDVAVDFVGTRSGSHRAWPRYRVEDILMLNPDVIVTPKGKAAALRALPGLAQLSAMTTPGAIVELDGDLLGDAGPGMLRAAEELNELLYPRDAAFPEELAP